ncbi:MAG: cupin domain-containing protein [Actinomycetota bacterium]
MTGNVADQPIADLERGSFDTDDYADELAAASHNHDLGTSLRFENDHVRVFEVRLEPGERGPFHVHDRTYFWTVVEPGRGLQRFDDGTYVVRDYRPGETRYLVHSPQDSLVHDLENVGSSTLRFVTVELKR